jgi:hypothetical protein
MVCCFRDRPKEAVLDRNALEHQTEARFTHDWRKNGYNVIQVYEDKYKGEGKLFKLPEIVSRIEGELDEALPEDFCVEDTLSLNRCIIVTLPKKQKDDDVSHVFMHKEDVDLFFTVELKIGDQVLICLDHIILRSLVQDADGFVDLFGLFIQKVPVGSVLTDTQIVCTYTGSEFNRVPRVKYKSVKSKIVPKGQHGESVFFAVEKVGLDDTNTVVKQKGFWTGCLTYLMTVGDGALTHAKFCQTDSCTFLSPRSFGHKSTAKRYPWAINHGYRNFEHVKLGQTGVIEGLYGLTPQLLRVGYGQAGKAFLNEFDSR